MASWSDNIEAVARAVCAKRLAHDGVSEDQLAGDVDMWWHLVAAEPESGVIDETGEYAGREINWKRKMDGYRAWMRRHSESRGGLEDRPVRGAATAQLIRMAAEARRLFAGCRTGAASRRRSRPGCR